MTLPLALCPWAPQVWLKPGLTTGTMLPNSLGKLFFFETGGTTPLATYQNPQAPLTAHSHPIILDVNGMAPGDGVYILPAGYTLEEQDSAGNILKTMEYVSDVGSAFLAQQGVIQSEGTTATSSPYTVQASDNMVIVDSADDPFIVQMEPAADMTRVVVVKNVSAVTVRLTPDGAELLENANNYYVLPAVTGALNPTATIISDGVSSLWITGGIGL